MFGGRDLNGLRVARPGRASAPESRSAWRGLACGEGVTCGVAGPEEGVPRGSRPLHWIASADTCSTPHWRPLNRPLGR